ncbi:MAG: F0F1 ATP synthase subunit B [Candidatus Binatia bacterium]
MLIDWFTVVAQIVNFLVLIALLKRFLYRPILRAMDEREHSIAVRLADAEEKKHEAEREAFFYRHKNEEFDEERQQLLTKAKQEAELRRQELIARARESVAADHARWQEALQRDQANFLQNLEQQIGTQLCELARNAFRDLANSSLEHHIIDVFLERLHGLDTEECAAIALSLRQGQEQILVRSAFTIPARTRDEILQAVRNAFGVTAPVHFEEEPELLCGIELRTPGHRIAWNVAQYVKTLEKTLRYTLAQERSTSFAAQETSRDHTLDSNGHDTAQSVADTGRS